MPSATNRQLIALRLPPGPDFIDALDAAWAQGHAVLPVGPNLPADRAAELVAAMQPEQPVDDGVVVVIATSGSTGVPKGVQLSRRALEASIDACHARIGRETGDVWLSCLPWQGIGGLQVMLRARRLDIPLVVLDHFDVGKFEQAEGNLTSLVPVQLAMLLDAGVDLTRFRVILLGGAAAAPDLLARSRAAGLNVVTTYGMSETAGGCVYDGVPLDGVEVAVAADRQLRIRGAMLMSGYRGRPDLTAEALVDGWLHTSDQGSIGPDGTVTVVGRTDDVIITGGNNVAAAHVVSELSTHPAINDVAVVGVADPTWGQRVVAAIVMEPGCAALDLAQVQNWCAARLTSAERPRQLLVLDVLPRLPSGKVDRLELQKLAVG